MLRTMYIRTQGHSTHIYNSYIEHVTNRLVPFSSPMRYEHMRELLCTSEPTLTTDTFNL